MTRIILAGVACIALVACQGPGAAGRRQAGPSASPPASAPPAGLGPTPGLVGQPSPPPAPAPLAEHLVMGGALSGTVTAASPLRCGRSAGVYAVLLQFDAAGQPYQLDVGILDYHGPGSYPIPPERVSLHTASAVRPPHLFAGTSGTVTVNGDERSGSLEIGLQDDPGDLHLSGTFRCG